MNSGKPFLILVFFIILIALFAGGAIGDTDLTPNTPPAYGDSGGSQALMGVQSVSTGICGGVYTVRSGDTLSRIALNCGVALRDILAINPGLGDGNFIRPGQKINLIYRVTETPPPSPTVQPTIPQGAPKITGLRPGGEVVVAMEGFQPNAPVTVSLSPVGGEARTKTEVQTNASGKLNLRLDIPVTATPGDPWVVIVTTINPPNISVSTPPFTIEK